ncbi:MAG: hypothetical protein DRN15_06975 [Thermoprotei archaeon]|nr:MAG: hypothetical protein DRN15_06975 [Thermoprotei archaeon]RLF24149.1 MAG: hypothetical protein DRM97_03915 [Thermoprotei archaeon]
MPKKTLQELVEIMVHNGVELEKVRKILLDLGFPRDKVEDLMVKYSALVEGNEAAEEYTSRPDTSRLDDKIEKIVMEEEIRHQRSRLDKLEEQLIKMTTEIASIEKRLKVLEEHHVGKDIETKVKNLEAKLEALIDVLIDLAPSILNELRARGVRKA